MQRAKMLVLVALGSLGMLFGTPAAELLPSSAPPSLWGYTLGTQYTMGPGDTWEYYYDEGQRYMQVRIPSGELTLNRHVYRLRITLIVTVKTRTIVMVTGHIVTHSDAAAQAWNAQLDKVVAHGWAPGEQVAFEIAMPAADQQARTRAREAKKAIESEWKSRYGAQPITYAANPETAALYTLLHFQEAGIVMTIPHQAVPIHVQLTLSADGKRLERYEQLAASEASGIRDQNPRQRKGK
jgi:hypothetical protein